jgi:hypothetical protein
MRARRSDTVMPCEPVTGRASLFRGDGEHHVRTHAMPDHRRQCLAPRRRDSKTRRSSGLAGTAAILAAFAVAAQVVLAAWSSSQAAEPVRAVNQGDARVSAPRGMQTAGAAGPAKKVVPVPTAPQQPLRAVPQTLAAPATFEGPTANITNVGNAISVLTKSITTLVTVKSGLALTAPVTISIGYYSPWGTQRITQSYVASTGNRFLYNDREGDGKLRQMNIDITLSEPKPGGGGYTGAVLRQVWLDPLYDVTIGPLKFELLQNCDTFGPFTVGDSEIRFQWYSPDSPYNLSYSFSTQAGRATTIDKFKWQRREVSASANLRRPHVGFWENDPGSVGAVLSAPPKVNLVPGKSQELIKGNLSAMIGGPCTAYFEYPITRQLRWYPFPDVSPPSVIPFGWINAVTTANTTEPVGTKLGNAEDTVAGHNIRDIVTSAQVKVRPDNQACQACHIAGGSRPAWDARTQTKTQFCGRVPAFNSATKPQILKNLLNNWGSRGCPD